MAVDYQYGELLPVRVFNTFTNAHLLSLLFGEMDNGPLVQVFG